MIRSASSTRTRLPTENWLPGGASSTGAGFISRDFAGRDLDELGRAAASREPAAALAYPLVSAGERFPFVAPGAHGFVLGGDGSEADRFAAGLQGVGYVERLCFDYLDLLGAPLGGRSRPDRRGGAERVLESAACRHPRAPDYPHAHVGTGARNGRSRGQPWSRSDHGRRRDGPGPGNARPAPRSCRTLCRGIPCASWTSSRVAAGWVPPSRHTPGNGHLDEEPTGPAARRRRARAGAGLHPRWRSAPPLQVSRLIPLYGTPRRPAGGAGSRSGTAPPARHRRGGGRPRG